MYIFAKLRRQFVAHDHELTTGVVDVFADERTARNSHSCEARTI